MTILKFVSHSKKVLKEAHKLGWKPGARYTNLRDVRDFKKVWFVDIDWRKYNFEKHLAATKLVEPYLTIAKDVEHIDELEEVLDQAEQLNKHAKHVAIVPKATKLGPVMEREVPNNFIFGYSVKTKYGGTEIPTKYFKRPVHLLGGRPDTQRHLANEMPVVSVDCNRFTLDAAFGDYFDGETFRPHKKGGYLNCIRDSIKNINSLWSDYSLPTIR